MPSRTLRVRGRSAPPVPESTLASNHARVPAPVLRVREYMLWFASESMSVKVASSILDEDKARSMDSKEFPAVVFTSRRSILLMLSAWDLDISILITALASPKPSSLSERNMAVSDRSNLEATVLGFVETSSKVGLVESGSVPFSGRPTASSGLPVTTRHPDFSQGFLGRMEKALNSWFSCDQTLRPKIA